MLTNMETPKFTPPFAYPRKRSLFRLLGGVVLVLFIAIVAGLLLQDSKTSLSLQETLQGRQATQEEILLLAHAHERAIRQLDERALMALYRDDAELRVVQGEQESSWKGVLDVRSAWLGSQPKRTASAQEGFLSLLSQALATNNNAFAWELQKDKEGAYSVVGVLQLAEGPIERIDHELSFSSAGLIFKEQISIISRSVPQNESIEHSPDSPVVQ